MAYATVDHFVEFMSQPAAAITSVDWPNPQVLQRNLELAAAEIDVARASSGQLSSSLGPSVGVFLELLNLVGAVLITKFDNVQVFAQEELDRFQEWKDTNVEGIRTGEIVLIAGATGKEFPSIEIAEIAWTPATGIDIIINQLKRESS